MHLLLRTASVLIASVMHRLLACYAVRFNPTFSGNTSGTDIFFSIATDQFFMRLQSAGMDLSTVIAAAHRNLGIEEKKLARPTLRVEIARARIHVSYVATQNLAISGSKVTRQINVDRSAISRASQRVSRDPKLPAATKMIKENTNSEKINIETTYP